MTLNNEITWSQNLAYAIGLFVADGSLSKDKRHFDFTSKDPDQVKNFALCLGLKNQITTKSRGVTGCDKKYYHVQFGNVDFYRFLNTIGIKNNKSLSIERVLLPNDFFPDFLRGLLDGDGSISISSHPESILP